MPRRPDYVAWCVIGAIVMLIAVGYAVFPAVQRSIAHEDCVGHGATNCP